MTGQDPVEGTPETTQDGSVRVRYGRITAFGAAVLVTLVSLLGGIGLLPSSTAPSYAASGPADTAELQSAPEASTLPDDSAASQSQAPGRQAPEPQVSEDPSTSSSGEAPVPYDSGTGKRVVFSISQQRVWLVKEHEAVKRTYLVSGSVYDNLAPGIYQVYSRSRHAIGVDDSGTMDYMVRFAHGANAAIGFHDIPVKDGELVQTRSQLGTALSHGCVRQWRPDAKAMWAFAPLGTEVDVVA